MRDDIRRIACEATIINRLFKARDLAVRIPSDAHRLPSHYLTPTTVVYDLVVPMRVDGNKLLAQQEDALSFVRQFRRMNHIVSADNAGMEIMPTVRIDRYEHTVEISRPQREVLRWAEVQWEPTPMTAMVGLRYTHAGAQPVLWSLANPDQPHALIAGTTGSGKTNTLLDVLYSLMLHISPAELAITVVDPKRSEDVQWLDSLPHVRTVARDLDEAVMAVLRFHGEMEQREMGVVSKGVRHVLAVEECASLTEHPDRQTRNRILFALADISRRCRENNMNLIVCTQKPTADVLGDQLKSNLALRLVGSVTSKDDANTAVQVKASGAEALPGYGSFIYRLNRTMFRFQAPLVDTPAGLCRRIKSRWGAAAVQGGAVAPVRTGATSENAGHTRVNGVDAPAPAQVVQFFPLADKRALTAEEAGEVKRLAGHMSKNRLCIHVYGAKSTRYMAWINEALNVAPEDKRPIVERSPFSFRGAIAPAKPQ